jgi:TolA-binding protein
MTRQSGSCRRLAINIQGSDKAPDALLKMVPSLRKLNQFEEARKVQEDLLRLYPDSAAAQKALSAD